MPGPCESANQTPRKPKDFEFFGFVKQPWPAASLGQGLVGLPTEALREALMGKFYKLGLTVDEMKVEIGKCTGLRGMAKPVPRGPRGSLIQLHGIAANLRDRLGEMHDKILRPLTEDVPKDAETQQALGRAIDLLAELEVDIKRRRAELVDAQQRIAKHDQASPPADAVVGNAPMKVATAPGDTAFKLHPAGLRGRRRQSA